MPEIASPAIDKKALEDNIMVITRPKADAQKLADTLIKDGFNCIIEPMLSVNILYENIKPLEYALDRKPQLILATSKYAILALAMMTDIRHIPILAVGQATATRAINLGFSHVNYAHGTAHSLVATVINSYSPANGTVLYIRGVDVSADIVTSLVHNDFTVDSVILYQANAPRKMSEKLYEAITRNKVNSVLFFSQNTVKTYSKLVTENNIAEAHKNITALCMSKAIAEKARNLLTWKDVTLFTQEIQNIL